jgi:ribosomal protein L40E
MPEETVGYVNLEWTCKACGTRNKGTSKTCVSCGAQMSEQDQFELPAEQQLITDEAEKKRAEIGPDVMCPYCNTRNPANATRCSQCNGDLVGAQARAKGQVLGAYSDANQPDVACPYCSALNAASATKCKNCGGTLKKSQVASTPTAASTKKSLPIVPVLLGALVLILLAVCGSCFALTFITSDKGAVVQSVSWERSIAVTELKPVTKEDWRDEIPNDARMGTCTQKVRRTQDQPAPGAEKVCGTPYVVDQGTGQGKVVQQCQYKIYEDYCKYTKDEWTVVDTLVSKGTNLNPSWPNSNNLRAGQKTGNQKETYLVTFNADGKQYTYETSNASEFAKFTTGSQWSLKVNALGAVTSVQAK